MGTDRDTKIMIKIETNKSWSMQKSDVWKEESHS